MFGYDIGDERRYIVGPENAMRDGEEAAWSIRLDRIEDEGSRKIGVFDLTFEERRARVGAGGGMMATWKHSGELRVNEYGFPEELRFSVFEEHTGESPWRGEIMSAAYTFDDGEYRKVVRVPDQEWEFGVPIARHDDLDLEVPSGMFLFRPAAAELDFFANEWEQRFLFFKPDPVVRFPNETWVRTQRDSRESLGRYYEKITIEARDTTTLELAGRTLNVRRLSLTGPIRNAYVDEFGVLVQMDIDPDPRTRRERHIRLLYPSEY